MYLAKEQSTDTKVYGIDKHEFGKYLKIFKRQQRSAYDRDRTVEPPTRIPHPFSVMKFEIVTSGGMSSFHLFVQKQYQVSEEPGHTGLFVLGRATTCDIVIG